MELNSFTHIRTHSFINLTRVSNALPLRCFFYKIAQDFFSLCRNPRPTQPSLNTDVKAFSEPMTIVSLLTSAWYDKFEPWQIWGFLLVYHISLIHAFIHSVNQSINQSLKWHLLSKKQICAKHCSGTPEMAVNKIKILVSCNLLMRRVGWKDTYCFFHVFISSMKKNMRGKFTEINGERSCGIK